MTRTGGALRVSDSTSVSVGGSCDAQPDAQRDLPGIASSWQLAELRIDAGDLDDSVHAEFWNVYLWGGDGNDALTLAG